MSLDWISIEDELAALSERVTVLLAAVTSARTHRNSASGTLDPARLPDLAAEELRERSRRSVHLPEVLFGEPAWDILLDLYVNASRGIEVSVSSGCIAAQVPATTGLRWIGLLETQGFISRRPSATDRRAVMLDLTAEGRARVECVLAERQNRRMLSSAAQMASRSSGTGARGAAAEISEKLLTLDRDDPSGSH